MNTLTIAVFVALAAAATASYSHGTGAVVQGPSGVVTSQGAYAPAGYGLGQGLGHGLGLGYGSGYVNQWAGSGYGLTNQLGYGGYAGYGHGGVTVQGPATVPAVISGPSGKIVANGLYGVPSYGYGTHNYW